MNITLFGKHLGTHGPSRVTRGLSKGLAVVGHDVTVIAYGDRTDPPHRNIELELIQGMPSSVIEWWSLYREVRSRVESLDSDVFHALERYPFKSDVRTVQWTSDMVLMWERAGVRPSLRSLTGELIMNWLSRRGTVNANTVVAQSPETVSQMRRFWRLDADHTIPLGIEEEFLTEPTAINNPPVVSIIGRIDSRKGQLELMENLPERSEDYEIRVIGGIKDETYARNALEGWTDRHLGYLDDARLQQEYELADIIVVPSHLENFSMVGLEAMAKGCALIITKGCGLAQYEWATEEAGVLVANDGRHAAELIQRLATSSKLEEYQQSAFEQAQRMTWEAITEKYLEVYQRIQANYRNTN